MYVVKRVEYVEQLTGQPRARLDIEDEKGNLHRCFDESRREEAERICNKLNYGYQSRFNEKTGEEEVELIGTGKVVLVRKISTLTQDALKEIHVGHDEKDGVVVYSYPGYIKCKNVHVALRVRDEEVLDYVLKKLAVCWTNFDEWAWNKAREADDFTVDRFLLKEITRGARFEEDEPLAIGEDEGGEEII